MDPLTGLLVVYGVVFAARYAWKHASGERRTSRGAHVKKAQDTASPGTLTAGQKRRVKAGHDLAWWASEIGHGFPVHRTGFTEGWLSHKTAMAQHRGRREEAKTAQVEAEAATTSGQSDRERRRREAQAVIDAAQQETTAEPAPAAVPDDELAPRRATREQPPSPAPAPAPVSPPAPGRPAPPADGAKPMPASDVNYTQSIELAKQIETDAEAAANDGHLQQMENHVDALGALLRGDTATLSDCAEVADALKDQRQAMERTQEAAAAFRANLEKRHGGIKEAADDAGGAQNMAEPEFYED
jgi:hypothetical protein